MLQQFTWQELGIATGALVLIWYTAVILVFYRKELSAFLNRVQPGRQTPESLPHRRETGIDRVKDLEEGETLMGRPQLPAGMTRVSTGGFGFARDEEAKEQQIGLVPDVLEEVKSIFNILSREDGNKRDFFSLMKLVKEKYPGISSSPSIGRINGFIAEHAPFHLSAEELEGLWD